MNKRAYAYVAVAVVGLLAGIYVLTSSRSDSANTNDKISVVTSFYPMYYLASEIGGDRANVINVTPSGSEPHDFQPSTKDLAKMSDADILILNGGGVEAWGDAVTQNLASSSVQIIVAGEGLFREDSHENEHAEEHANEQPGESTHEEHDHGSTDPHVWLNPVLMKEMASRVANSFVEKDPLNKVHYLKNLETLSLKLDALDSLYREGLASCSTKNIVTSHEAFSYMAERYGLTQVPINGLSPDAEPSASELAKVSDFARANNVKYIFFETLVSPRLSETVAKEIGAQTLVLNPLEGITTKESKEGKNYITVMEDNLRNLQIALQCN